MLNCQKTRPRISKALNECLNLLLDELQLSITWSRPSILLAVHRSRFGQEKAIQVLKQRLSKLSVEVVDVNPRLNQASFLENLLLSHRTGASVFFIRGLGNQSETFDALNMHREAIVENQLKLVFWLTAEESIALSQRAPDFWAFRHLAVEFPLGRHFQRFLLPSGTLLWHNRDLIGDLKTANARIDSQEKLLRNISIDPETVTTHAHLIADLAHLYWLIGENQRAEELFREELRNINPFPLNDMKSILLNGQAVSCYDRGAYRDALALIESGLAFNQNDGILWANHGIVCRASGQSRRSFTSIRRAIKTNPESSDFWSVMGYVFMSMGKFDSALEAFEHASSLAPDRFVFASLICHFWLGNVDSLDESMHRISQAIQDGDEFLVAYLDGLLGKRTTALVRLNEIVQDRKIMQVFIRRDPRLYFVFGNDALANLAEVSCLSPA